MNQLNLNPHHFNTSYTFKFAETQQEFSLLKNLRIGVFVKEQFVPIEEEIDKHDFSAHHAIAIHQKLVIATGRVFRKQEPIAIIGRMAVMSVYRRERLGTRILNLLETKAIGIGCVEVELHAQIHAQNFYESNEYVAYGKEFEEAGIQHVKMKKNLLNF